MRRTLPARLSSRLALLIAFLLPLAAGVTACGGAGQAVGGALGIQPPPVLHEAAYDSATGSYRYVGDMTIQDPPIDADWSRWAMCHDGSNARLFVMRNASPPQVYMFVNLGGRSFTYVPVENGSIPITGAPADASLDSFATVHGDGAFRLYLWSRTTEGRLYQFGLTRDAPTRFEFGAYGIPSLAVRGWPADANPRRWAMHEDGSNYRILVFQQGSSESLYQAAYNASQGAYQYGYRSRDQVSLLGMPASAIPFEGASLHDGGNWRFYQMGR